MAGGEETQVLDHGRQGFWAVADAGIFLLNPETKSGPNIEFFSFATGRVTKITKLREDLLFNLLTPSISVSRDTRWILYVQIDQIGSDLVLVDNFR